MSNIYLFRRKTAADWTAANPVLMSGELGLETDTTRFKFGNGTTAWNSLAYAGASVGIVPWGAISGTLTDQTDLVAALATKQATLVSATNIKTINGASILGAGNLTLSASAAWGGITGTLSSQTDLQTALNLKAPLASPTFTGTVSGITAAMVGAPSGSGTSTGSNTGDQTITLTGDVTGSGTGSFAATIANAAVTYAKMQATALGNVVLGKSGAAGAITEIQLGTNQFLGRNASNITPIGIDSTLTITGSTLGVTPGTYVVGPGSATDNAITRFDSTTGKLVQDSLVTLDDSGVLGLPSAAISAPVSGIAFGADAQVGIVLPTSAQTGLPLSRMTPLDWKRLSWYGTAGAAIGLDGSSAATGVGTLTAKAITATNIYTRATLSEYLVTVAATNAIASFRWPIQAATVGGGVSGAGGFYFRSVWGPATGVATTTLRAYWGVRGSTTAPTDVEPSTLVNIVGMGWDAADTNIQIMHNDATGTATKIDLGASFPVPTVDRTSLYQIELFSPPGTTQSVQYRVVDMSNGTETTGTITTDLPATSQALCFNCYASAGGTSSVVGIGIERVELFLFPERI